jgi:hypothetical protein
MSRAAARHTWPTLRHTWPTLAPVPRACPCGTSQREKPATAGPGGTSQREKPATAGPGGQQGGWIGLTADSISTFPSPRLEGFDGVTGLFHGAGHEAAHGVLLPAHLGGDLGQGSAALALQHRYHLRRLAALANFGLLGSGSPGRFGGLLCSGSLGMRLGFGGRTLSGLCALALRLRLLGFAQVLDARPDSADSGLGALETLRRLHAGQAVPELYQSLRRPRSGQFRQILLAAESLGAGSHFGGGPLGRREGGDVVVGLKGKRHFATPSAVDYRDHDIHHSGREQMQANSERVRRSEGDGVFHELAEFGS